MGVWRAFEQRVAAHKSKHARAEAPPPGDDDAAAAAAEATARSASDRAADGDAAAARKPKAASAFANLWAVEAQHHTTGERQDGCVRAIFAFADDRAAAALVAAATALRRIARADKAVRQRRNAALDARAKSGTGGKKKKTKAKRQTPFKAPHVC